MVFLRDFPDLMGDIVDGSEILRSPVEVGSLSHDFLKGFSNIPGAARSLSFHQL